MIPVLKKLISIIMVRPFINRVIFNIPSHTNKDNLNH